MLPHQDNILALPLSLTPEETILLLQEKIARLVEYNEFLDKPKGDLKEKFEEFRKQSYLDQVRNKNAWCVPLAITSFF
jgi:FtsZ-binding cell division protein ZapB